MKIVGLNGSHRQKSNCGLMMERALELCAERGFDVEQIDLWDADIRFCSVCDLCAKNYSCSIDDDCMGILERLKAADAILVASPVYFGGVSGRLRSLFDRTLPLRRNGMLLSEKVGAAFAVGGSRNGGQEHTVQQIHLWMLIHEMAVVGDRQSAHFGGICIAKRPMDVLNDEAGMTTVMNTADNVCRRLKK
jgi:multimeric flavodoxin WrbA